MAWKWFFFLLVAVGLGVMWQNVALRKQVLHEIKDVLGYVNTMTEQYEGWQVIFVAVGSTLILSSFYTFLFREDDTLWSRTKRWCFRVMRKIPFYRTLIDKRLTEALKFIEQDFHLFRPGEKHRVELPKKGLSHAEIMKEVQTIKKIGNEDQWRDGFVSGALYNCSPELTKVVADVYASFSWTNPLHPDVFPEVRKMEAEVVSWSLKIFNGGKDAQGTVVSGGTEAIFMAMRAYRGVGYERGIEYPEIVCSVSAHCAFNKAAEYMRMKITQVPVDPNTRKVDMRAMARAISKNTVVLVGSSPQFPHGIVDPIEDIGKLAIKYGIGVHVDCCLGSYLIPFMKKAGFDDVEPFDFSVPGVTSISADTHKYGYSPKGTSVIMYSSKKLCHHQYFTAPNWQGGIYATPTLAGSRAGGVIAATWATMMHMGENGYVDATRKIITPARKIIKQLKNVPGIFIFGEPKLSVIALGSNDFNIYRLGDALKKRGWNLNLLQFPRSIHFCLTLLHSKEGVAERFINDVGECTAEILKDPKAKDTGSAAMYGMAQAIPDRSIISELAVGFLDILYQAGPTSN